MIDPNAVYLEQGITPEFKDGSDITQVLQNAINQAQEKAVFGIVFIESGNYFISDTIHIWKGIRLIGYGPTRPKITLSANAKGYNLEETKYLFHFTTNRPKQNEPIRDANPGTFYSAFTNIDVVIAKGNPSAVSIRSHFAQHCFVSHVTFDIGEGLAGIDEVGNIVHDCEFIGGNYGIMTKKPSPSWPFVLADCTFKNQTKAAILTEEAGMTIVRSHFEKAPFAILTRKNRSEELVIEHCEFNEIENSIVLISEEYNARTQINIIESNCEAVGGIAQFRQSGRSIDTPAKIFQIVDFSHGLHLDSFNDSAKIETRLEHKSILFPNVLTKPHRTLGSNLEWMNVTELGLIGDGVFDNTALLQKALDEYNNLYFPSGRYLISDTLKLKKSTSIVGLSPITTQIVLVDKSEKFHPAGSLKAMILSARGGNAILQGIGIDPGGINHRAVPLIWRAGSRSLVNDVRFLGGHGTYDTEGNYLPIYNNNRSADSNPERRWDSMPASLWVTDQGGGTFQNIWTPSPFAHAGMLVENTSTPGRVYQLSSEHHIRNELILRNVKNWSFYAIQFEEEAHEGERTLPIRIEQCADLEFNNTYIYRVSRTRTPYPHGVWIQDSAAMIFRGIHTYGPTKFTVDNTLFNADTNTSIRSREIARLEITGQDLKKPDQASEGAKLLADGFNHIESPEVDSQGNLYFVDRYMQQILCWEPSTHQLRIVMDLPIDPAQIILSNDDTLLIFTRTGKAYELSLKGSINNLKLLEPKKEIETHTEHFVIPNTRWRDSHDFMEVATETKPYYYHSRNICIPAEESFVNAGARTSYFRTLDLIRTFDLIKVSPGDTTYVSDEFSQKTWRFTVSEKGTLISPELFAEEGEAGALQTQSGKVIIAAGNLFIYQKDGTLIKSIEIPQRPTALIMDKNDPKLLYVLARTALYQVDLNSL